MKQSIQYGLKLNGIECAIKYKQKDLLKPYIDLNPRLRQGATNEFEKEFLDIMNATIYTPSEFEKSSLN